MFSGAVGRWHQGCRTVFGELWMWGGGGGSSQRNKGDRRRMGRRSQKGSPDRSRCRRSGGEAKNRRQWQETLGSPIGRPRPGGRNIRLGQNLQLCTDGSEQRQDT